MQQTKDEIVESLKALEAERKELLNLELNKTSIIRQEIAEQKRLTADQMRRLAAIVEEQNKQEELTAKYQERLAYLKLLEEEKNAAATELEEQVQEWLGVALAALETGALSQKDLERVFLSVPLASEAKDGPAEHPASNTVPPAFPWISLRHLVWDLISEAKDVVE
ncbi:MAG: hypothetical protein HN975_02165 [Anaerolineae bacterium]|nr:hypothetical protein [Anaerolineae bacterium]